MKRLILICLPLLFISCNQDDDVSNNGNSNQPPRDFEAKLSDPEYRSLIIRWTESTDPENSLVSYNVYIAENIENEEPTFQLIGEGITEAEVADKEVIEIAGVEYAIPSPDDANYRFAYVATGLNHATSYVVKIEAVDQDGQVNETHAWSSTLTDSEAPVLSFDRTNEVYRYNHGFVFRVRDKNSKAVTVDIYLNKDLIESIPYGLNYWNGANSYGRIISYRFNDLQEATTYNAKIVARDIAGNESESLSYSFTTTGNSYIGDLLFHSQWDLDLFGLNKYQSIEGRLTVRTVKVLDLKPLGDLTAITGSLQLDFPDIQDPLSGFNNLKEVGGSLFLNFLNPSNLLNNLESIGGDIFLKGIYQQNNDDSILENLIQVGNMSLSDKRFTCGCYRTQVVYQAFDKLTTVGDIRIEKTYLSNLDFLGGISQIDGALIINDNRILSDFCGVRNAVLNGLGRFYTAARNEYNPTLEQIESGACQQ